jgi:hypothetical protein
VGFGLVGLGVADAKMRMGKPIYIDILYTLDSASNYSAIQKLKP